MASYAVVETALARMHGADPEVQRGAFRGRIKHLQRLGLPLGVKPGKGKRIDYTEEQIWQLALALELAEFGIDPTIIANLLTIHWETDILKGIRLINQLPEYETFMMVFVVSFMSFAWRKEIDHTRGLVALRWVRADRLDWGDVEGDKRRIVALNIRDMLTELSDNISDVRET